MLRKILASACATAAAATVLLTAGPASAKSLFPGAGYSIAGVDHISTSFVVPTVTCTAGLNTAATVGLISPYTGTLDGWNAVAVIGCSNGKPWYRIQAWVNQVGYGHTVAAAAPGDHVVAQLVHAGSTHPTATIVNTTNGQSASYKLAKPATTVAAGTYAGAVVPQFSTVTFVTSVNDKPVWDFPRVKHDEYRNGVMLMSGSYLQSDGHTHTVTWKHA